MRPAARMCAVSSMATVLVRVLCCDQLCRVLFSLAVLHAKATCGSSLLLVIAVFRACCLTRSTNQHQAWIYVMPPFVCCGVLYLLCYIWPYDCVVRDHLRIGHLEKEDLVFLVCCIWLCDTAGFPMVMNVGSSSSVRM